MNDLIHRAPLVGACVTACCGKTPFELPRHDRIATDPDLVTCWTGSDPRLHALIEKGES